MPNWETVKVLSLGWGEVPGNCCPQPQASANNSSCLISCLLPRDNSSDCFPLRHEIIVYYMKKKSTLLRFKSRSNPLSCHCNVILLPFFFSGIPRWKHWNILLPVFSKCVQSKPIWIQSKCLRLQPSTNRIWSKPIRIHS